MAIHEARTRESRVTGLAFFRNILYAVIFPAMVVGLLLVKIPDRALVHSYLGGRPSLVLVILGVGGFIVVLLGLAFIGVSSIRRRWKKRLSPSYVESIGNDASRR